MNIKQMFKLNEEDLIKKIKKMEEQREKDMQYITSDIFLDWLKQAVKNRDDNIITTDDFSEEQNIDFIKYFVDYVELLANQQRVMNVLDEDNYFQTLNYAIRIDDNYYKVSQMHGQGCVDMIESIGKPNYCYVKVR